MSLYCRASLLRSDSRGQPVKQDRIDRVLEDDSAWIGGSSERTPCGTVSTKWYVEPCGNQHLRVGSHLVQLIYLYEQNHKKKTFQAGLGQWKLMSLAFLANVCATSRLEGCSRAASAAVWNTVGKALQKPNVVGLRTVWVILIKILELWPAKLTLNIKLKRVKTRLFLFLCIWVLAFVSFDKVLGCFGASLCHLMEAYSRWMYNSKYHRTNRDRSVFYPFQSTLGNPSKTP